MGTPSEQLLTLRASADTSALLRQAMLVLANRTDSTTPSTAHVAAAVTLVHACVLESAAAVDHAITTAAPAIPASPAFIADADEGQAEERRAMPVLQLLMKTASWADQCASKLSSQSSARETPDDESYAAVSEVAQVRNQQYCLSFSSCTPYSQLELMWTSIL